MTDATHPPDDQPTAAETYAALRRHLRRREGFGLVFVRCAPAEVAGIMERLREDLPSKQMEVLALEEAVEDVYDCIEQAFDEPSALDVLFVTGLEKSLVEDIRPGIGARGIITMRILCRACWAI